MLIHPRSEVFGSLVPCNRDGSPRPRLAPCRWLTVHWVGAGQWGDPGDTPSEMRSIHAFSMSPGKATPWEYNEVVDAAGEAWIYAGEFVAAHSAGENPDAYGVLMLAGIGEPCPDAMVDTLRRRRYELVQSGQLRADHQIRQHNQMPGAATSCPGPAVIARWAEIATPWTPPPTPPEPDPIIDPPEDDVQYCTYRDLRYHNVWLFPVAAHLSSELAALYADLPRVESVHDQTLKSLVNRSGIEMSDLVPV
jgi:hypothetical protein